MKLHRIADLYVAVEYSHEIMTNQSKQYLTGDKPEIIDIVVQIQPGALEDKIKEHPELNKSEWEYMMTGAGFYKELLHFNGMMLHSSAVVVDGRAYLFSAPSGTGKSTHTGLWLKQFGERARILNDDKPAIRLIDGKAYAYGTPWSGKTDQNINERAELAGICFLGRAKENSITRVDHNKALVPLMEQTIRPDELELMDLLIENLRKLLVSVPFFYMGCNMDLSAAQMSYDKMSNEKL